MKHKILLQHEGAAVVLNLSCRDRVTTDGAMNALKGALTDWKNTTEEGRFAWLNSGERFTIENLAFAGKTHAMCGSLHKFGITNLVIDLVEGDQAHGWNLKSKLMD